MSEYRLITDCKRGKLSARRELYNQYASRMMALCIRYVGNEEDAKDVLQEGFIKVFTQIEQFSGEGAFGGWIRKVFVNVALEFLRSKKRKMEKEVLLDYSNDLSDAVDAIDTLAVNDLLDCIAELPEAYRTVFNLFAIEGFSHREIATMLHIEESTSRSQFFRARRLLQEKVAILTTKSDAKQ